MDNNDYRDEQQTNQQNNQQNNQQYNQQYSQQGNQQGNRQKNYGQCPPPPFKQQYYYYPNNKPPYNPQQQYYCNQTVTDNSKNYAVASLVLGILSILTCGGIWFAIICGVLALVFSMKSKKEIPIGFPGRKLANAGYVLSIIGLSLAALTVFSWVSGFMSKFYWRF